MNSTDQSARRRGALGRFARSRNGAAAVEFAMVSIPFLGLLCAIFETALVLFTHAAFDNAVNNVARKVLINNFTGNSTPTASNFLANSFCPALPSFIDCSKVTLNIQAYNPSTSNFSSVSGSIGRGWYNSPSTNVNLGQPGYIVVFQAFYPMPVYLSVLVATGAHGNGAANLYNGSSNSVYANPHGAGFVHAIFSTAVFRNEPT
ncbi:TadE/TadG family type IV pilus assembly protein [uncultured Rhodoblastus sp.]|uniref:TadE/TadG family type IV pilus assembly protein n=1 Tax=uncultured Rhodoblastus sp. TaxID=543037 RepID=UPI0025EAF311|nr:TadE/TadG family type IV pilus assembly protein [uncultured Rhodoblastus sp.]